MKMNSNNQFLLAKDLINKIKELDFNNKLLVKATLSKAFFSTKEYELYLVNEELKKCKLNLYQWLDKTETPYLLAM